MKIVVVGAGAIGGYFGGRLAEAGFDITFLVRQHRAAQLSTTGLNIKSPLGDITIAEPKLALHSKEIDACDLVILAVKNYQLREVLPQLRALVELGAKVLPLLNGVEHLDILGKELGGDAVLGGLCHIISTLDPAGKVQHSSLLHTMVFGPRLPSQQNFCNKVQQVLEVAKFKVVLSRNILIDVWAKYAFITVFSGITTASRLPIDRVLKVESTKNIYVRGLQEMWGLARANGVMLPENFVSKNVELVTKNPNGSTSSMHQDFRKGLPLEVESLQGAAVRIANRLNIDIPTIFTFYGLIKPYELGLPNVV